MRSLSTRTSWRDIPGLFCPWGWGCHFLNRKSTSTQQGLGSKAPLDPGVAAQLVPQPFRPAGFIRFPALQSQLDREQREVAIVGTCITIPRFILQSWWGTVTFWLVTSATSFKKKTNYSDQIKVTDYQKKKKRLKTIQTIGVTELIAALCRQPESMTVKAQTGPALWRMTGWEGEIPYVVQFISLKIR